MMKLAYRSRVSSLLASTLFSLLVGVGCGSDDPASGNDGGGGGGEVDSGGPPDNMGTVPDPVANSGVAYVAHYLTQASPNEDRLLWYRTDGASPESGGSIDVGQPTQDMALDPYNDILALASDAGKLVQIFSVDRPTSAGDAIDDPSKLSEIDYGERGTPISVIFSPHQRRLLVFVSPTDGGVDSYDLYSYDVSDPASPQVISGFPVEVPVTVFQDIDSARGLLFVVGFKDKKLHAYDFRDSGLTPLPGEAPDLEALFPERAGGNNSFGFGGMNIEVDPWRQRVYVVKTQGVDSEMMAFSYPDDVPRNGAKYTDFASASDLQVIDDAFDIPTEPESRPNLLGGFNVDIDNSTGQVFMTGDAWNGSLATGIVFNFGDTLATLGTGCNEFEGFGCFIRSVIDSNVGPHLRTDGAMCVDTTHKVVVTTSVELNMEDPASTAFFSYDSDSTMERWLSAAGGNLAASSYPIAAVCH